MTSVSKPGEWIPVSSSTLQDVASNKGDDEMSFYNNNNVGADISVRDWEERCVHIREGQIQIDLSRRVPPLDDEGLVQFCEWLDVSKLPVILSNHRYLKKTGVGVELSDNRVGPVGIEKLLSTLLKHEVPCTTLKVWRNVVDDGVADCIVQYLHIQPATMPLSALHFSHNRITSKGALRLIRGIVECGHYPLRMSRKPFWLRIEFNEIERPEDIVHTARTWRNRLRPDAKFTMCLMQKGLCSSPDCDHETAALHAPYFLHQNRRGYFEDRDKALIETAAFQHSYDPASTQQTLYDQKSSGVVYRQNLTKAAGPAGAYSAVGARPAPAMQFLEVLLDDCCGTLGFSLGFGAQKFPTVRLVDASGEAGRSGLKQGMVLKRANGVDVSLLNQQQVQEVLKQRPLSLRFGFA